MDAEHRHELKQNDFVEYAKKTPGYIKDHWWETICVVVIIFAVVLHFSRDGKKALPNLDRQAEVTEIYQDLSAAKGDAIAGEAEVEVSRDKINELIDKAGKLKEPQGAFALIKAADGLRALLHYSNTKPSQEDIDAHTTEAISLYERALENAEGNVLVAAMAEYGIALAMQDAGKFDEAANLYGKIIANTKYDSTALIQLAKDKLASLNTAKQQFNFTEPVMPAVVEADGVNAENQTELQENTEN